MLSKIFGASLKNYNINPIVKVKIMSDFVFWSASNLVTPILAVFIADRLEGGSLEVVGISATLYLLTKSLVEIPTGMLVDKTKSEKDDLVTLVIGTLIQSSVYFLMPLVSEVNHIYLAQIFLGLGAAIAAPGWYKMFTRHMDKEEEGFEWSLYDVVVAIGMALTAAIGGIIASRYGFDNLFIIVGALMLISAFIPLFIKNKLKFKE